MADPVVLSLAREIVTAARKRLGLAVRAAVGSVVASLTDTKAHR